jgi:hypothetical protein
LSLKRFATATRERVLIVGESRPPRNHAAIFRRIRVQAVAGRDWAAFLASDASGIGGQPAASRLSGPRQCPRHQAELYADVAPGKREGAAAASTRCCAICRRCGSAIP